MRSHELLPGDLYLTGAGFHLVIEVNLKIELLRAVNLETFQVRVLDTHTNITGAVIFRNGVEIHRGKYADDLMNVKLLDIDGWDI